MSRLSPVEQLLDVFSSGEESNEPIDPRRIPRPYFEFPIKTPDDWMKVLERFTDCLSNLDGQTESFGKLAGVIIDIVESPEYFRRDDFIETLKRIGKNLGYPEQDVDDLIGLLHLVGTAVSAFLQLQRELFRRGELAYPTGGILYPITAEWQMEKLKSIKVLGTPPARTVILNGLRIEEKMRNAVTYADLNRLQDDLASYSYKYLLEIMG